MTTRTVSAMFDSYTDARQTVSKLEAAGIPHDQISIVSNDASHKQYHSGSDSDADSTGAGTGASLGTLIGGGAGLLAGLGLLAIPGLGPVVAAGWLASTALGAGVGAAAGGLAGALVGAGIDENDAQAYAEGVRRGGTLVSVRGDEMVASRAADILDDEGTIDMDARERDWRNEGWTGGASSGSASGSTGSMAGSTTGSTTGSMSGSAGAMGGSTGSTTGGMSGTRSAAGFDEELPEDNRSQGRVRTHVDGLRQF